MENLFDINGRTDEELLGEYSVKVDGRTFVPARLLDTIGKRRVKKANRQPGDPGTVQNPIFRDGKAYIFSSRNELIWWEDYDGSVPDEPDEEFFVLTMTMKPSEDQKRMIQRARKTPVVCTADCPMISSESLAGMRRFAARRPCTAK